MSFLFRPKSRVTTSRATATILNTLNMLSPTLLLLAVALIIFAPSSKNSPDMRNLMVLYGGILVAAALVIRVVWGLSVRSIRKQKGAEPHGP